VALAGIAAASFFVEAAYRRATGRTIKEPRRITW
jgi:hypothetical protein